MRIGKEMLLEAREADRLEEMIMELTGHEISFDRELLREVRGRDEIIAEMIRIFHEQQEEEQVIKDGIDPLCDYTNQHIDPLLLADDHYTDQRETLIGITPFILLTPF